MHFANANRPNENNPIENRSDENGSNKNRPTDIGITALTKIGVTRSTRLTGLNVQ